MTRRLLVELFCEEIPMGEQIRFAEEAPGLFADLLMQERVGFERITSLTTPRRLTLVGEGVDELQEDLESELVGPPVAVALTAEGQLTRAGESFLAKAGVTLAETHRAEKSGRECIAAWRRETGGPSMEVLRRILPAWIAKLPFAKSMRWATHPWTFSRPLRSILALFGSEVVAFDSHGLTANRLCAGHRFLDPTPAELDDASNYEAFLEKRQVLVDPSDRRERIHADLQSMAQTEGLDLIEDEQLLDEVVCLVEQPTVVIGRFNPDFLAVPAAVILSAMRKHQRYFAFTQNGKLAPRFATVLGTRLARPEDALAGNQRVLSARLADARFFWDEDRKTRLEDRRPRMEKMVYHQKLGTMWDKIGRVMHMAGWFAERLGVDPAAARRAAELCKMDLETQMVYEFPDLQGEMGAAYARSQGESPAVCDAIFEHYLPRYSKDRLPATDLGRVVALADRVDTLCGGIAAGLKPTGSADPFALRRAALGLLRILLETGLDLSLTEMFTEEASRLPLPCDASAVREFVVDRLRSLFADDAPRESVEAVLAVGSDRPVEIQVRLRAVLGIAGTDEFAQLVKLFRRMNILKKAERIPEQVRPELLSHPAEQALHEAIERVSQECGAAFDSGDVEGALRKMVSLWKEVDDFFDDTRGVRVMADEADIRDNRLALLYQLDQLFRKVADFRILAALA